MAIPTVEELWQLRDVPLADIRRRFRCSYHAVWRLSRDAGFRRGTNGNLTHAPCAICEESMPIKILDSKRRCEVCLEAESLTPYEQELRAWRERRARRAVAQ